MQFTAKALRREERQRRYIKSFRAFFRVFRDFCELKKRLTEAHRIHRRLCVTSLVFLYAVYRGGAETQSFAK